MRFPLLLLFKRWAHPWPLLTVFWGYNMNIRISSDKASHKVFLMGPKMNSYLFLLGPIQAQPLKLGEQEPCVFFVKTLTRGLRGRWCNCCSSPYFLWWIPTKSWRSPSIYWQDNAKSTSFDKEEIKALTASLLAFSGPLGSPTTVSVNHQK